MTQAMDPQQELYNRQRQQLQQNIMASNQARGLNMSGVGAGIEAQALGDFSLDWQDRLLKRSTDAAAAYGGLAGLAQGIAQSGFTNAGQLGASQFQYPSSTPAASTPFASSMYTQPASSFSGSSGTGSYSKFTDPSKIWVGGVPYDRSNYEAMAAKAREDALAMSQASAARNASWQQFQKADAAYRANNTKPIYF
jgi:hypothetical protein